MAAPMVAGAAALMLQKDPTLNPATVKARLMKSAVKDTRLVFETGAGALDVYGAVNAPGSTQNSPSPQAMVGSDGCVCLQDTALLWGSSWSQGAIWGAARAVPPASPLPRCRHRSPPAAAPSGVAAAAPSPSPRI